MGDLVVMNYRSVVQFIQRFFLVYVFSVLFAVAAQAQNASTSFDLSEISLTSYQGESLTMADFDGRTLIVNFWASWCPPCVKELPDLQYMAESIDSTRYQVILISVDAQPENGEKMLDQLGIQIPAYADPKMEIANGHFKVIGFPETLIIQPTGEVFSRFLGPREWRDPELWQKILP